MQWASIRARVNKLDALGGDPSFIIKLLDIAIEDLKAEKEKRNDKDASSD